MAANRKPAAGPNPPAGFEHHSKRAHFNTLSCAAVLAQFTDAMRDAGLCTDTAIVADGTLHRFHVEGDKPLTRNGWYVLHADGVPAGAFGNWKAGLASNWRADMGRKLNEHEERQHRERMAAIKRQREQDTKAQHEGAQLEARKLWASAKPADAIHPYLVRKAVAPYALRQHGRLLLVPLCDLTGVLWNIQTIASDGNKLFQRGGRITGLCSIIGTIHKAPERLLICEGWATGATLHAETATPALCAMTANNLKPVALAARALWPDADLILCGDNDRNTSGNPGAASARAAAEAVGGRLVLPQFKDDEPGSDFNDLTLLRMRVAA